MFVVTAEKSEKKHQKKEFFWLPTQHSPFFPQPSYLPFIPYLMKNLNHFGKKGLDKRHLVAIPTLALTFPLWGLILPGLVALADFQPDKNDDI